MRIKWPEYWKVFAKEDVLFDRVVYQKYMSKEIFYEMEYDACI